MNLQDLRQQIDNIDDQILDLLIKRLALAPLVAETKKTTDKEILDSSREEEILQKVIKKGKQHDIPEEVMRNIWEVVMEESRRRQGKIVV